MIALFGSKANLVHHLQVTAYQTSIGCQTSTEFTQQFFDRLTLEDPKMVSPNEGRGHYLPMVAFFDELREREVYR